MAQAIAGDKPALTPDQPDRLVKLLGLPGSAHDGERAAAAMVDKLIRGAGLSWPGAIAPAPVAIPPPQPHPRAWREPPSTYEAAEECLRWPAALTAWERQFLTSLLGLWPWTRAHAWRRVKAVMRAAGTGEGPHATAKGLRHGYGVHAIGAGVPLNRLSRWMGHASLEATAVYAAALGAEEQAVAARM